jgi:hypothetical protein
MHITNDNQLIKIWFGFLKLSSILMKILNDNVDSLKSIQFKFLSWSPKLIQSSIQEKIHVKEVVNHIGLSIHNNIDQNTKQDNEQTQWQP